MKFLSFLILILLPLLLTTQTHADELRLTLAQAKAQGFIIQKKYKAPFANNRIINAPQSMDKYRANQLPWPFELPFKDGFIGNNFAQYQPYVIAGYHGGSDMVLESDSWIYAPVNGLLEAGHYAYTDNPDGSRIKHWKPWPQAGDPNYFELAVIDNEGNRFELHHVDRATLPKEVVAGLNQGNFKVSMGAKLGRVVDWGMSFHYDHVHVNIHDQQGNWYNPEHFFKMLPDTIQPKCKIMAIDNTKKSVWVTPGFKLTPNIVNFVALVSDQKLDNHFSQVPVYFELKFDQGDLFFWDFRRNLISSDAKFADIRQVYAQATRLPTGQSMRQPTGYYPNDVQFLVNLPIPSNTGTGQFQISVQDMAGNSCIVRN
jgi:hypothetical protein